MKKLVVFLSFIALMVSYVVACTPKQRPSFSGIGLDTTPPPSIDFNVDLDALQKALGNIKPDGVGFTKLDNAEELYDKYLVSIVNGNNVIALGIGKYGDVFLGYTNLTEGSVKSVINDAGNSNNWDPRKLVYYDSVQSSAKIAWTGRAGTPPQDGSANGSVFVGFKGYDTKYGDVLQVQGKEKTFSILSDSEYKVYYVTNILTNVNKTKGKNLTWERIKDDKSGDKRFNFVRETTAQKTNKAWSWDHNYTLKTITNNAKVLDPRYIRFAYVTNDYSYPYKPGSNAAPVKGKKSEALDLSSGTPPPAEPERYDNSAPNGKTIIARSRNQLDGKGWGDYFDDYIMFLTTVVGYNVRVKDYEGDDISGYDKKKIKEVIVEFDETSFIDAQEDGWTSLIDNVPKRSESDKATDEIGTTGGSIKTFKVPFLLIEK